MQIAACTMQSRKQRKEHGKQNRFLQEKLTDIATYRFDKQTNSNIELPTKYLNLARRVKTIKVVTYIYVQ